MSLNPAVQWLEEQFELGEPCRCSHHPRWRCECRCHINSPDSPNC